MSPRALALAALGNVLQKKQQLDEALKPFSSQLEKLESRDRAFVRLLTTTTLRHLGLIDRVIKACLDHPISDKQIEVKNILRLATAQLLYLDTPPHAAVSTALDLATHPRNKPFKGLINALLRRIAEEGKALREQEDPEICSVPPWFWNRLSSNYGEDRARAIIQSQLQEPPLDLSVKSNPAAWAEKLGGQLLPNGSVRLPAGSGDPSLLEGYTEGEWWIQDAAASLPAKMLGRTENLKVADLCAAPGGKTAELASSGAEVLALDISAKRLERLEENMERLGYHNVTVQAADIRDWAESSNELYDAILLDAPCSATGTLRRHPELIRIRKANAIESLSSVQTTLLEAAWKRLKPGGTLVFSTCSLEPEEGQDQVDLFLAAHSGDAARNPLSPEELAALTQSPSEEEAFVPLVTADGDLRCLPCHWRDLGGMDGFFASRLIKKKPAAN
ncbi:RsmB/NOP family class I SAM-dependent RNA methyltransferase [Kiloniella sp. b19]|uniref:RsmB/NOP family class I SAM-dependent RNA methyltransferase n=1 Tax=Kiloniella sp. GXU_MW_B19 TaxID=3141326 RepID=UPI0031DF6AD5